MGQINWIGVVVATVVAFFIGFLWYGVLFETQWMALNGITPEMAESGNPMWMLVGLVQTFITMAALGWFINRLGATTWIGGARVAGIACVGFALMALSYGFIYMTDPIGLIGIDFSHLIAVYLIGGAIIGGLKIGRKAA